MLSSPRLATFFARKFLPVLALAAALTGLLAAAAQALPSASWSGEGAQAGAAFGFGSWPAGDVNGDGYSDFVYASPWYDSSGADRGRAWVRHGSPAGLGSVAWQVSGVDPGDHYGYSVAGVGDINGDGYDDVLVGAALSDTDHTDDGAIYLYYGSPSGLPTTASWWRDGPQNTALLGTFVAGGGDFNGDGYDDLVAGAPGYNPGGLASAGRIQIYYGSASFPNYGGSIEGTAVAGWMGASMCVLDLNGDGYDDLLATQLFGAPLCQQKLFLGGPGGLSTVAATSFQFGDPVGGGPIAAAGDVDGDGYEDALFGWPDGNAEEGWVRLWYGSSDLSTANEQWWDLEGAFVGERLGLGVGGAGDVNGDGHGDFFVRGMSGSSAEARLYYGSKQGPTAGPVWDLAQGSDQFFAWRMGTAGDVDGDGYSDIFVASPYEDNQGGGEGRIDLFRGSADAPGTFVQWNDPGIQADCLFSTAVALGDFDGNGTDDVAVGTGSFDGIGADAGSVFVYNGRSNMANSPDWIAEGEAAGMRLGDALASALDVDGDGYEDLLVGAPGADGGRGEARLYRGTPFGLDTVPAWSVAGPNAADAFGFAVASAGDLDADGYADVIIGAPGAGGSPQNGRAYIYLGSPSGLSTTPASTIVGEQVGARLGFSVAFAGDVNGDGHSDVIIGAPLHDEHGVDDGVAFIHFGFSGGVGSTGYQIDSGDSGAQFGFSVGSAGDVDADGHSDVIVGAPFHGATDGGRAELYRGASDPSLITRIKDWTAQHPQGWFGWSVGGADFDQDGLGDVVIGAPGVDNGQVDEGQVWGYRAPFDTNPWFGTDGNVAHGYHGKSVATGDVSGDGYPDILAGAPGKVGEPSGVGTAHVWPGNGMWNGGTTNPSIGEGRPRQFLAYTSDLDQVVPLLGGTDDSALRFGGFLSSPLGRDRLRLEVEVKPIGAPFDGAATVFSSWLDTGAPGENGSRVFTSALSSALDPGAYHWRVRVLGERPTWKRSPWFYPTRSTQAEIDFRRRADVSSVDSIEAPELALAAYPSVFRKSTVLRFEQPGDGYTLLRIYDATGREVGRPIDGVLGAGVHEVVWRPDAGGRDVPNGVFFARLDGETGHATLKLVLVR